MFGIGQLVLIPLATHIARNRLKAYGKVQSLSLSAFPAVELLWGQVDRVSVKMATYTASGVKLDKSVSMAGQAGDIDAQIGTFNSDLLTLHDVTFRKRGQRVSVSAQVTDADLRRSLPVVQSVTPVSGGAGGSGAGLALDVKTAPLPLFGQISAEADVTTSNGRVIVGAPQPLGSILHLTVFSDPRLYVQSVSGHATAQGMSVTASGRLR